MGNFYSRLSYSFGNEDWNTEHRALRIQPTDRVLCVTASGDRPLNLMTAELKEIVAVDANPLQNALFNLKKVALSKFSYSNYMAFMGAHPCKNRLHLFSKLEKNLDPLTASLWNLLPKKIEQGVLYSGSVEKLLKVASTVIRTLRGKKVKSLFSFDNLQDQQQFMSQHWHTYLWKKTFDVCLHPLITRTFIKDPGLYEHIDPNIHIGKQIYERLHTYLSQNLAKESTLLSLLFRGKVDAHHFPPYLTEEGVKKIKKQAKKAHFYTDDLVSFIEKANSDSFDCYSVSDVASYLNKDLFVRLVEGIYRTARPGARFCIRQFLSNHQIPEHLSPYFKRDTILEKQLQADDRCCVYTFMTGTILKV